MRIVISACLLGMRVRYDGGHKAWDLVEKMVQAGVTFIPICPEAESGLGVPREPMRLEGDPSSPFLRTLVTRKDHTQSVTDWIEGRLERLGSEGVDGFLLKSRSPSCGVIDVPVYDDHGVAQEGGEGLFARACKRHFSALSVAERELMTDWPTVVAFLESLRR
ncbi:MAG: DUF523 domain-containing protein [Magnetococcales bacterium]|nr:DUF523 domain-containing protein [Magnetococcales bacterium]